MCTLDLVQIHFQVGNASQPYAHAQHTIKGNVNWMRARQNKLVETLFGDIRSIIVDEDGSDSAIVDNALEFLSFLAMEPEKLLCC